MVERRHMLAGSVAAGSAALLMGLNKQAKAAAASPIPIGAAMPLTGPAAAEGIDYRRGLEMGVKDINDAGGILGRPLELHVEDTQQMGVALTSQAMQRLIDRYNCGTIINGYNSGTNMVEMDIVASCDVLMTYANSRITHAQKFKSDPKKYYGSFLMTPTNYYYGPGVLEFMKTVVEDKAFTPPNNKIALITSSNEYCVQIAEAVRDGCKQYGFEISTYDTVPFPNNQWGPVLAKIRQNPPGFIINTHLLPQDLAAFMQQFNQEPTQSLVYLQYGPAVPAFREIGKEAVNGVLYSTLFGCLPDAFSAAWRKRYQDTYGANAAYTTGSQTYESVWQWATAAAMAGGPGVPYERKQTEKVAKVLVNLIHRGVNGTSRFDPQTQTVFCYPSQEKDPSLALPLQFFQHQDYRTEPKLISPLLYKTADFKLPPWIKA